MRAAYLFLALSLVSCGTFTRVSPDGSTTVQAGFASSIQAVTVQVKPNKGSGPTVTVVQTGYDGTSVPNNLIGTWGTSQVAKYAFKGLESNNVADVKKAGISSKTTLGTAKIAADKETTLAKVAKAPIPEAVPAVAN